MAERRSHELKTWPEFFSAMLRGDKPFDVRQDDCGFAVGDSLWFREWDPFAEVPNLTGLRGGYTGREADAFITYVLRGGQFGIAEGYVVLGIVSPPAPRPALLEGEVREADGWSQIMLPPDPRNPDDNPHRYPESEYRCENCGFWSTDREHFRRIGDLQLNSHLTCTDEAACRQCRTDRKRNREAWNDLQAATPCARCGNVTLPNRVLDANHGTSWYCASCAQETSPVDP